MNNPEKIKDDILRQYIGPESTEKAPEGFTANIMSRIQVETVHSKRVVYSRQNYRIPALSVIVTFAFIAAVLLIGNGNQESLNPVSDFIRSLKITLPPVELPKMKGFNLPSWFPYIFISILILAIFDRSLFRLFHRDREKL
jgi:hypothetical protein